MRILHTVALTLSILQRTSAIPWIEPSPTLQGHLLQARYSPRTTDAPRLNGIPRELARRQQDVIYPPPPGWCGFINDGYDDPLTCQSTYTCVVSRYAVGCCPESTPCTNIFTACKDATDVCDSDCRADDKVLKCTYSDDSYCGTYRFSGGTRLYNCDTTTARAFSVEFLADYYITAIGSTLASSRGPFTVSKEAAASSTSSSYRSSYTYKSDRSSSYTSTSDSAGGLSVGAIQGIAIGISVAACAVFIGLAICIVKRRRAKRIKQNAQATLPPAYSPRAPVSQLPFTPSNPVYQVVPQQDQSYNAYHGGYFAPDAVGTNNRTSVLTQPTLSSPTSQQPPCGIAEADGLQRPTSTHQGMVSPMTTSSSPPPNSMPQFGQQYAHLQQQQSNQGQAHNGYAPPRVGIHEAPLNQAHLGPYEMPDQRH
ncbi:MAG: hypothetical protein Q9169_007420 [Polycauliona sp. 2 TL-2023]